MSRPTFRLLKQTSHPPKQTIPLALNPLTRWSRALPRWSDLPRDKPHLDQLTVGLEGCHAAFNATNSIRTCLFFGTASPPIFLTLDNWRGISHAQARPADEAPPCDDGSTTSNIVCDNNTATEPNSCERQVDDAVADEDAQWNKVAYFGMRTFLEGEHSEAPIVALENFTSRSESILTRRVPYRARLVVGHENQGVSDMFLFGNSGETMGESAGRTGATANVSTRAEAVVYIPQYGTISSVNVVTSMGIAFFYAFLDEHFPSSRSLPAHVSSAAFRSSSPEVRQLETQLREYQQRFESPIPTGPPEEMQVSEKALKDPEGNRAPRLDLRPLHPNYFRQDVEQIQVAHAAYRRALLQYSNAYMNEMTSTSGQPSLPRTRFGISVLYENEYDQRNFGGLIRNANAFLVDMVCYLGKRRFNVVGAVGSNRYTPPVYMGQTFDQSPQGGSCSEAEGASADTQTEEEKASEVAMEAMMRNVLQEQGAGAKHGTTLSEHQERIIRLSLWSLHMRGRVEKACGGRSRFWFLDCGHRNLYAEDFAVLRQMQKDGVYMAPDDAAYKSSLESLVWYMTHCTEDGFTLSLCDTEETLREAAGDGVVLVVPQEGKLPHISLLMQCEKILTVVPDDVGKAGAEADILSMRGLPSQVASGIALQRLSAVLHPALKEL